MKKTEQIALEKENETLRVRLRNRNKELVQTRNKFQELAERVRAEVQEEQARKTWEVIALAQREGVPARKLAEIMECSPSKVMQKTKMVEEQ